MLMCSALLKGYFCLQEGIQEGAVCMFFQNGFKKKKNHLLKDPKTTYIHKIRVNKLNLIVKHQDLCDVLLLRSCSLNLRELMISSGPRVWKINLGNILRPLNSLLKEKTCIIAVPTIHFTGMFDCFYESWYLLRVVILLASIILTLVLMLAVQRTKNRHPLGLRSTTLNQERVNSKVFITREKFRANLFFCHF